MRMYNIIENKRNGNSLSTEEIFFFINKYTSGEIPDYQASALLMAIYFQDMNDRERGDLTLAMVNSGDTIDLSEIKGIKVDKHSTGGVGDTTTLVLAPLVASLDIPVAKMSGRGLGHTGGTIDKLEAIPGFHVEISNKEFITLVNKNKLAVIGQSGDLTPADKKIYSLRDVTATVNSIPLIASSIMSKKIASGADAIVLDVKTGKGAFMEKLSDAKELAEAMVAIGKHAGKKTVAIISDMNQPLGYAIGNALEVKEAIKTLKGNGPHDLTELSLSLGSHMVVLANKANNLKEARKMLEENIVNGKAFEKFKVFLSSQGGDSRVAEQIDLLPDAKYKLEFLADKTGYINSINANGLGSVALMLGAGRVTKESEIDQAVGLVLNKKVGEYVTKGESLLTIHSSTLLIDDVKIKLNTTIVISNNTVKINPLIYDVIS